MSMTSEDFDTELRLSLGQSADVSPAESISSSRGSEIDGPSGSSAHSCPQQQQQQQKKKKVTMFYNGQICVCDITEVQVKAILSMARREIDDTISKNNYHQQQQQTPPAPPMAQLSPPQAAAPPSVGLSMKRSLQRFLKKRKSRIAAISPYNQKKQTQQLSLFPINSLDLNSAAN